MITELKEHIAEKLKASPIPIISAVMYGSWARNMQTKDSDIDILIISDMINPHKHKRGKEIVGIKEWLSLDVPTDILLLKTDECISNFRNHNPLFLDIAHEGIILMDKGSFLKNLIDETIKYIHYRGIEKRHDGWRFPVNYREATNLSSVSNKDFAIAMLTDGKRDFNIGISIMKEGYFDKAVYHFQQAVEKAIKAILISFGEFRKVHFVGEILIGKLRDVELTEEWKDKLSYISRISEEIEPEVTWSRYPGIDSGELWLPYEEYTEEDSYEIRVKSKEVMDAADEFIIWWFKP